MFERFPMNRLLYFKLQEMQLTDLLQRRLKIALNAAQTDPANSDSIKTVLSVLTESLTHHSTSLELAQSQLASKVGDAQFKRALSGKLSVKQFLGYFQKIERVVQKMENYWSSSEQKTQQLIEKHSEKLQMQLGDAIQAKVAEIVDRLEHCEDINQNLQEQKRRLANIENQIHQLQKKNKTLIQHLSKKQSNPKQEVEQQKMKTVLDGIRQIQTYFNETHYQIKSLLQSIIQSGTGQQQLPTPSQNQSQHQKLEVLDMRIIRCEDILPNRWVWEWNPHAFSFNWESRAGRKSINIEKVHQNICGFPIKSGGFYKLTIGYIMDTQSYGALNIFCNNRPICTIELEGDGGGILCKTTMLYSWISSQGIITIEASSSSKIRGFLELQNFD